MVWLKWKQYIKNQAKMQTQPVMILAPLRPNLSAIGPQIQAPTGDDKPTILAAKTINCTLFSACSFQQ